MSPDEPGAPDPTTIPIEAFPDAVAVLDGRGTLVAVNRAFCRLLGMPRERLDGASIGRFLPPGRFGPLVDALAAPDGEGRPDTELPLVAGDGTTRELEWSWSPLVAPGRHLGVARDASRRRAELREAREREERLRLIVDSLPVLVSYVDPEQCYRFANRAYEEWFGVRREDLEGRPIVENLGEEAYRLVLPQVEAALAGSAFSIEAEMPYRGAGPRAVSISFTPHRDDRGGVLGFVALVADITARKRAEEALRRSEGRFRHMADHAPVLIRIVGTDGRCTWVNQSWLDFTGRSREQEAGDGWAEGIHPDDLDRFLATYRAQFDARLPFELEYRLRRRDGTYGWLLDRGIPQSGPAGAFAGYIGSCADISEIKRAEARLRLLAEAGRVLGSSLDYEATLADVCAMVVPSFADWCTLDLLDEGGAPRQLAVAHKDPAKVAFAHELRRRYPPREDERGGLLKVLRTGEPELYPEVSDELLAAGARDAEHLAILDALGLRSIILVPLRARGRTLGVLTLVSAESGRRFGADDLHLALELANRAALAVDNSRLFSQAREAAARREEALLLHREVEEQLTLLVEASGSLSASLERPAVMDAILALSRRLIAADAYAVWRRDAATGGWAIAHASGLSDAYRGLDIPGASGRSEPPREPVVAEDVRAVPLLEARARFYEREGIRSLLVVPLPIRGEVAGTLVFYYRAPHRFSEVEVRVATALANLAGSAVGTAELYGELMEADRRKDEFLAMLAHELRNPLSAIANAVQLARRGGPEGQRRWTAEVLERQVAHLARLVDDLLDVSRITRGKIRLRVAAADLVPVVRAAVETARPLIEGRRHRLEVALPDAPLMVLGDPTRLEQVACNLLTNAAKYTPDGGTIRIAASRDGGDARVEVRDDGDGIPTDQLSRIFELFAQGDRSLARSEGGLGIGLTLVRALVGLHGGTVAAASDGPGTGSTFTVRLPLASPSALATAPAPAPAPSTSPDRPPAAGRDGPDRRRILVVDDNVDNARVIAQLLRLGGHDVRVAHDGPSGLDLALEFRPEFVLMDIGLPGLDGYETARRLRAQGLDDAVIVAVSGYGREEDRRRSREAGMDHHLTKPIDHDALAALLPGGRSDGR